eukprot:Platyproteum_vivax@DN16337_c0_g1_i1.p1
MDFSKRLNLLNLVVGLFVLVLLIGEVIRDENPDYVGASPKEVQAMQAMMELNDVLYKNGGYLLNGPMSIEDLLRLKNLYDGQPSEPPLVKNAVAEPETKMVGFLAKPSSQNVKSEPLPKKSVPDSKGSIETENLVVAME